MSTDPRPPSPAERAEPCLMCEKPMRVTGRNVKTPEGVNLGTTWACGNPACAACADPLADALRCAYIDAGPSYDCGTERRPVKAADALPWWSVSSGDRRQWIAVADAARAALGSEGGKP